MDPLPQEDLPTLLKLSKDFQKIISSALNRKVQDVALTSLDFWEEGDVLSYFREKLAFAYTGNSLQLKNIEIRSQKNKRSWWTKLLDFFRPKRHYDDDGAVICFIARKLEKVESRYRTQHPALAQFRSAVLRLESDLSNEESSEESSSDEDASRAFNPPRPQLLLDISKQRSRRLQTLAPPLAFRHRQRRPLVRRG